MRIIRKPLKVTPRKKLRAAAQRSAAKYAEEDYSAEEPNVKLSRAFVVVLLLHVVAVGGIFAFSALKDHQTGTSAGKAEPASQKPPATQSNASRENGTSDKSTGKTVPADVQKLVDSSHGSGSSSSKAQSNSGAQKAPANPRKFTWSKKGIVRPESPRSSKLVTRTC